MKDHLMKFSFVLLVLIAIPCFAQKVSTDYNKDFNFTSLKTYSWQEGTPASNPLMHQRVVKAIETNLVAKGFQPAPGAPDFYVVYHGSVKEELSIQEWGYRPRWGSSNVDIQKVPVGMLVVDILDGKDEQLIWRSIATDTVSDNPEKNEKKINKAAEKMFKKFPPSKTK